jgi:hypothetical protein
MLQARQDFRTSGRSDALFGHGQEACRLVFCSDGPSLKSQAGRRIGSRSLGHNHGFVRIREPNSDERTAIVFDQVSAGGPRPSGNRMSSRNHESHTSSDAGSLADANLIAVANRFELGLRGWIDFVHQNGMNGQDASDTGAREAELRATWGNDLSIVKSMPPQTLHGAAAKVSAAQAYVAFSSEVDCNAAAFLAEAVCELQHFTRHHSQDRPSNGRAQASSQRSPWLFDLLRLRT